MALNNKTKKEEIVNRLSEKKEEWFTLNQIRNIVGIHIYKAEVLLNELLSEGKVENEERGNFKFWRIKNEK